MKAVTVTLLMAMVCIPVAFTRMLPFFENLQNKYPGRVGYGGAYSDQDLFKALNLSSRPTKNNDTCILRMSTSLNLNPSHQIVEARNGSAKGTGNMYYFYDRFAFLDYLHEKYGVPLKWNTTEGFRGKVGIMYIKVTGGKEPTDVCSVLLWNGMSFHQGKGLLHHHRIQDVYLWPAPSAGCKIDLDLKQSTCFPSKAKVELKSGKKIPMSSVRIGDLVKTYSKEGEVMFSPVVTFLDQMPDYKGHYYTITTASNAQVTLSEAHVVFKTSLLPNSTNCSDHASRVRPGDFILIHTRRGRYPDIVTSVSIAERQGAFAPVTQEGTMIVDDVWVSCYADIADHALADSLMTPLKRFYGLAPNLLGAGGKYVHGYLKGVLRPIGVTIFGKEKFYQSPQKEVLKEKEMSLESFFNKDDK